MAREDPNLKATSPHSHLSASLQSPTQFTISSARPLSHTTLTCPNGNPALCMSTAGERLCEKLTQLFSTTPRPKEMALKLSLVTWLGQLYTERLLQRSIERPARGSTSER